MKITDDVIDNVLFADDAIIDWKKHFGGNPDRFSMGKSQWDEGEVILKNTRKGISTIGATIAGAGATAAGVGFFSSSKQYYEAPKKENKPMEFKVGENMAQKDKRIAERKFMNKKDIPVYKVKDRPVEVMEDELKDFGGVLFGEAKNNIDDMRKVANVVLNRMNESYKPAFNELSKRTNGKFEFQAYAGEQYNKYMMDDTGNDFMNKKQKVKQVLEEIRNGTLIDNINRDTYFSYGPDGKLRTTKGLYVNINNSMGNYAN